MATSLLSILESMRVKINALNESVETLRAKNRELEDENESLRRSLADANLERDKARLDSDFLAVSHRLAQHPDNIIEGRRLISRLIRNIDRCIEMLKE